jgi:hypothetical protein
MSRCQSCGRESPNGSVFCLNCGSRLAPEGGAPVAPNAMTPSGGGGLPGTLTCGVCGGPNQAGMNFCRHCGSPMQAGAPPRPATGPGYAPTPIAPPPGPPPSGPAAMPTPPGLGRDRQVCRRCGGHTALGFSFCQHCGTPLEGGQPVDEAVAATLAAGGAEAQGLRGPLGGPVGVAPVGVSPAGAAVTPAPPQVAPTPTPVPATAPAPLRTPVPAAGASRKTPPVGSPVVGRAARPGERAWGHLIAVRRDGSDGERFALSGEWVAVGRDGDLAFDDRYLAGAHARIEQTASGPRVVPIDMMNGVFRRLRGPETLVTGSVVLLGRELLRFDLVTDEERDVVTLVRHGTALFGSPARKPWGRLSQLVANGGVRDVRHLHNAEVVLGREDGDIVFRDDEFLSRRHAAFRWQNGTCMIEDLKSSNGSFVRLRGVTALNSGDTLRLGDQMFRFEPAG